MALSDIIGYLQVDERIATAGQPSEGQLEEIAADGYTVVINLGLKDPRYCLPDEAKSVRAQGMSYEHIPVQFDHPDADDFHSFLAAMNKYESEKRFVHCAANYRGSCFLGLYAEAKLGWSRRQADDWVMQVWTPNETWARFLAERRAEMFSGSGV